MPGATFLEGETVALCTIEEADLAFLCTGDNDPDIRRAAGGDPVPVSLDDERAAREDASDRGAVQFLVVAGRSGESTDGERVGYVELDPVDTVAGTAEVGVWITPEHRRRGYADEALDLVVGYAFDELRLHRVEATAFGFNEASVRRLSAAGFTEEGRRREAAFVDGGYVDVRHFGVLEDEWSGGG